MFAGHAFADGTFADLRLNGLTIFFGFGININLEYRIYVSTVELITDSDDTPASQPYSDVLAEPLDFTWAMNTSAGFGGFITGRGTTILNNIDGGYDTLTQRYTTDGRPVEVRLGRVGTKQTVWPIVFRGLASGEFIDDNSFEITTEDNAYKFDVPAQAVIFAGTGDLEGGADLAGKPLPLCYGWNRHFEAPLVIPGELLYRAHHGRMQAISAVYDQGYPLVFFADFASVVLLRAATIPPNNFGTCLADGYFKLGSSPVGTIALDAQGDKTDGYFSQTVVDIVRALIRRSTAVIDPDDFYLPSLDILNAMQPAPVGKYISHNDTLTVAQVIDELIGWIGAYAGFRREGAFHVGRVDVPSGPPEKRFDKYNFEPNPKKEKLPSSVWPPPAKWLIGYQRNYTLMTNPVGGVSDAQRSFLAAQYRYSPATAPAVKIDHPFGKDPDPVNSNFRDKADADAEAARRLTLWRSSIGLYSLGVSDRDAALLNVGSEIFVTHTRGDLVLGRNMVITQLQHKASTNSAVVQALG